MPSNSMLITISGTPGTGKTAVSKVLGKKLGAKLITTDYLAKKYKIPSTLDSRRKTKIIDTKKLAAAAKKESRSGKVIFEGHLAHFAPADRVIILRTSPKELAKRLKKKGWTRSKINENVEAEAIGVISREANGLEIDTTKAGPEKTAALIERLLDGRSVQKKYMKKIDWTKEYVKYLRVKVKM